MPVKHGNCDQDNDAQFHSDLYKNSYAEPEFHVFAVCNAVAYKKSVSVADVYFYPNAVFYLYKDHDADIYHDTESVCFVKLVAHMYIYADQYAIVESFSVPYNERDAVIYSNAY